MYTRSYNERDDALLIPEGYDGVALREGSADKGESEPIGGTPDAAEAVSAKPRGGFFDSFSLSRIFPSGLGKLSFIEDFGSEEILLIIAALYLLFSKNRDPECALILIALLFLK